MSDLAALELHINDLLERVVALGGSDLHLTSGSHPLVRINGDLKRLTEYPRMTSAEIRRLLSDILRPRHIESYDASQELDFAYGVEGLGRFRVNVFQQRSSIGTVMRSIPGELLQFDELGLPDVVRTLADLPSGLVLVSGPAGAGKSTTAAALIDIINSTRPAHVMTVEDPIEFLHRHKEAIVNQREVGEDTASFSEALRHVLRQDPDVVLIGELPDAATIRSALTAAETGHLVFATVSAFGVGQSLERLIEAFPSTQQSQIRIQLASAIVAVVGQQLIPRANRLGRTVASEILLANPKVRSLIREGRTDLLNLVMQEYPDLGMQTMDQCLAAKVREGEITLDVALERAVDTEELRRLVLSGPH